MGTEFRLQENNFGTNLWGLRDFAAHCDLMLLFQFNSRVKTDLRRKYIDTRQEEKGWEDEFLSRPCDQSTTAFFILAAGNGRVGKFHGTVDRKLSLDELKQEERKRK